MAGGGDYDAPGDPAAGKALLRKLAGTYRYSFDNGTVFGEKYRSTDKLVVRPIGDDAAFVSIHTEFFNGHECNNEGVARYKAFGGLVLPFEGESPACFLTFRLDGEKIVVGFPNRSGCGELSCGARGAWGGERFSLRRKNADK